MRALNTYPRYLLYANSNNNSPTIQFNSDGKSTLPYVDWLQTQIVLFAKDHRKNPNVIYFNQSTGGYKMTKAGFKLFDAWLTDKFTELEPAVIPQGKVFTPKDKPSRNLLRENWT